MGDKLAPCFGCSALVSLYIGGLSQVRVHAMSRPRLPGRLGVNIHATTMYILQCLYIFLASGLFHMVGGSVLDS